MKLVRILKRERYVLLLATQLAFISILPFLEVSAISTGIFITSGLSLVLIVATNAIGGSRYKKRASLGIAGIFILLSIITSIEELPKFYMLTFFLFFILLVTVVWDIVSMLIFSKEIKLEFIAGAIAGYLLMAVCFAFFCVSFAIFNDNILTTPASELGFNGILYYSLVTMTTIGYGDISPVDPIVRMAAAMTGVISQFYMAVVVAVIVGKLMNKRA